ncbi:MAG: glucosaminidase domain-containing protein [Vallitaleaceae bacterium]|nr:glucosaminidase domain-containing protein [Vallitaleaceae bacterium]
MEVSKKDVFTVNALEVFEACTYLDLQDAAYLDNLTSWINQNQSEPIPKNEVLKLTTVLQEDRMGTRSDMFPSVEAQLLGNEKALRYYEALEENLIADFGANSKINSEMDSFVDSNMPSDEYLEVTHAGFTHVKVSSLILEETSDRSKWKKDDLLEQITDDLNELSLRLKAWLPTFSLGSMKKYPLIVSALLVVVFGMALIVKWNIPEEKHSNSALPTHYLLELDASMDQFIKGAPIAITNHYLIEKSINYEEVNLEALKNWLIEKDSMLSEAPYFESIVNAAKAYNIHPLLMFAITGQEQAFVPKSNKNAASIANNPFNIYGSWEDYNTDIGDASIIAAKTVYNLSLGCPENMDIITWINRKYAEDPNWHIGVSNIFEQLKKEVLIAEK